MACCCLAGECSHFFTNWMPLVGRKHTIASNVVRQNGGSDVMLQPIPLGATAFLAHWLESMQTVKGRQRKAFPSGNEASVVSKSYMSRVGSSRFIGSRLLCLAAVCWWSIFQKWDGFQFQAALVS